MKTDFSNILVSSYRAVPLLVPVAAAVPSSVLAAAGPRLPAVLPSDRPAAAARSLSIVSGSVHGLSRKLASLRCLSSLSWSALLQPEPEVPDISISRTEHRIIPTHHGV